jgi:thioredoxin-like negative regulator of GroEL
VPLPHPGALRRRAESSLTPSLCLYALAGPCKLFKPTFVQFAEAYNSQASFISVVGDLNASTATLMKRLQVKSVPAFFFFKNGTEVAAFTGANKQGFRNNLSQFIQI